MPIDPKDTDFLLPTGGLKRLILHCTAFAFSTSKLERTMYLQCCKNWKVTGDVLVQGHAA